jgi:hypothetical protein
MGKMFCKKYLDLRSLHRGSEDGWNQFFAEGENNRFWGKTRDDAEQLMNLYLTWLILDEIAKIHPVGDMVELLNVDAILYLQREVVICGRHSLFYFLTDNQIRELVHQPTEGQVWVPRVIGALKELSRLIEQRPHSNQEELINATMHIWKTRKSAENHYESVL